MLITRSVSPLRAALFLAALCGCSATTSPAGPGAGQGVQVVVVPRAVSLYTDQALAFGATVTGTANTAVTWSVQEGSAGGAITPAGVYTAPASAGTYHVVVASAASPSVSASAKVTVMAQPPVTGGVWPAVGYSAACRDEPLRTTGAVYYFCDCSGPGADPTCVNGDDSRTDSQARNPATPWRTFSQANAKFNGGGGLAALAAGDTVAFCRGGGFTTAGSTWHNASCTASSTCDVRDYLPPGYAGADQKPVITYTGPGNAKALDLAFSGHEEGYRFMNLDLRAALYKTADSGLGFNFGNDLSNVLLCNMSISGFRFAWLGDGNINPVGHHIEVRGSTIRDCQQGAALWGCSDCGVSDTLFEGNGSSNGADHTLYLNSETYGGVEHTADRMFVTNNIIHPGTDSAGECAGVLIVAHGFFNNAAIDHNVFDASGQNPQGGCYGIMFSAGGSTFPSGFSGLAIRRNTFMGFQGGNQVSLSMCADCVVENNLFMSAANAVYVGEQYKRAQDLWGNDRVTVRNNTIYLASGWAGYGITFDAEGSGHVVANNLIDAEGSGSFRGIAAVRGLGAASFAYWDHNDVSGRAPWAVVGSSTYATASDLKAATGFDAWAAGAASLSPLLVNVPLDFRPQPSSPLVGAADPAQAPATDLTGTARPATPDIGAFQH